MLMGKKLRIHEFCFHENKKCCKLSFLVYIEHNCKGFFLHILITIKNSTFKKREHNKKSLKKFVDSLNKSSKKRTDHFTCAYFRTTVCQKASRLEIINYLLLSQKVPFIFLIDILYEFWCLTCWWHWIQNLRNYEFFSRKIFFFLLK